MNDEPSSSSSAPLDPEHGRQQSETAPPAAELAERRKKNRQVFNRKRGELLGDLLKSLDIAIYAELSAVYYMDCSFLRFVLRLFVQFMFLTPKPAIFPEPPEDRAIIGPILFSNMVCIFLHLWLSPPSAGEATRGYLHGGLAMDFIGQKGPTSKIHLLFLDLLVVLLQIVQLAAQELRKKMLKDLSAQPTVTGQTNPSSAQDLDAEERGVRRSGEQQDIEMQNLDSSGMATVRNDASSSSDPAPEGGEREALLASTAPRTDAHISDAFNSGQIVLADLDLWRLLKEQRRKITNPPSQEGSSRTSTLRAELAGQMLRMRFGTDTLRRTI